MDQERIKNRLYGFYGSKLPIEYQKGLKSCVDQLINSIKEECAKICDKNHIQIITEKSLDKRFVQTMNPVNAYNKANKDNAKAIREE